MANATSTTSDRILLNFAWSGPNVWNGGSSRGGIDVGVVNLLFKNAKTDVCVRLPENISPVAPQNFPFTCRKSNEMSHATETRLDSLRVTIEQIRNLTVRAGLFEKGNPIGIKILESSGKTTQQQTVRRKDRDVSLMVPEELELGQTYNLVVSSVDYSLTARLMKVGASGSTKEEEKKAGVEEFQRRVGKMGEALVEEGMQNFDLASRGGRGTFNSSSNTADVVAHGLRGVIRAGQEMHPEIQVPYSKPSESPADLDMLSVEELQSRIEVTFKNDKEFEIRRLKEAVAGNVAEMNKTLDVELVNTRLLVNLAEALERKGVKPKIPQSADYKAAEKECERLRVEAIKNTTENCKTQ